MVSDLVPGGCWVEQPVCETVGFSMQTFGLALLSYSRLYMGLTMFLCLSTGHPDAVGLVTQSSPWDVSHPLLEVRINA